jgi:hypothetical protein
VLYESLKVRPLSRQQFARRMGRHFFVAAGLVGSSLFLGMLGYVAFERLSWIDAFLNAAMLLGGMGPVNSPQTTAGKLFAGCYALYAGLVFLVSAGVLATPLIHRIVHRVHFDERDGKGAP